MVVWCTFMVSSKFWKISSVRLVFLYWPFFIFVDMDWSKVISVPKYNPMMFTLVRHLEGLSKSEFAKKSGLTTKRLSNIEYGNVNATDEEVEHITKAQSHVIQDFFMQWHEFETEWLPYGGVPKQVNYYKFKIFRDSNPPPLTILK